MYKYLAVMTLAVLMTACTPGQPTQPDESGPTGFEPLTQASLVAVMPTIGATVARGEDISITVHVSYNVSHLLDDMVQPRLLAHRAGDPATMFVGGIAFPSGSSYREYPNQWGGEITFDGELGSRAFFYAEAGTTIDYVLLSLYYREDDKIKSVFNLSAGQKGNPDSAPISLNWKIVE